MEILTEPPLHESRDCFAILDKAKRETIATHGRNTHGLGYTLDHCRRRREIGITGSEIDDVDSACDELALLLGDLGQGIFRKT